MLDLRVKFFRGPKCEIAGVPGRVKLSYFVIIRYFLSPKIKRRVKIRNRNSPFCRPEKITSTVRLQLRFSVALLWFQSPRPKSSRPWGDVCRPQLLSILYLARKGKGRAILSAGLPLGRERERGRVFWAPAKYRRLLPCKNPRAVNLAVG